MSMARMCVLLSVGHATGTYSKHQACEHTKGSEKGPSVPGGDLRVQLCMEALPPNPKFTPHDHWGVSVRVSFQ